MSGNDSAADERPAIEVHVRRDRFDAAQSGGDSRLGDDDIRALQTAVAGIVAGFRPPDHPPEAGGYTLDEFEVAIGFKIETGTGAVLRLVLDGKAEAELSATLRWKRP